MAYNEFLADRIRQVLKDRRVVYFEKTMMDFTKRPMKGFVNVSPEGMDMEEDLDFWIGKALEFNPKAKRSKK